MAAPAPVLLEGEHLRLGRFDLVVGEDVEGLDEVATDGDQRFGDRAHRLGDRRRGELLVALQLLDARKSLQLEQFAHQRTQFVARCRRVICRRPRRRGRGPNGQRRLSHDRGPQ